MQSSQNIQKQIVWAVGYENVDVGYEEYHRRKCNCVTIKDTGVNLEFLR
jgi:hypothetical protein